MTAFQKIIKYFAISLAAVVIVSIVSGITFGIYVAGNVIGLIRSDDSEVLENLEVISGSENASASKLEVELGAMNFCIKKGDEFKVEANKSDVKFEVKDNVAYIKDDTRGGWFNFGSIKGSIVVYIPGESEIFEGVVIKGGAGVINIDDLKKQLAATNYVNFKDFRRYVLEVATKEINLYTDIEVSWEPIYKGRKVIQVKFLIKQRDSWGRFMTATNATQELDGQMSIYDFLKEE